jgi:hypothetical protein
VEAAEMMDWPSVIGFELAKDCQTLALGCWCLGYATEVFTEKLPVLRQFGVVKGSLG